MIPTVLLISILTFFVIELPPGDYVSRYVELIEQRGDTVVFLISGQIHTYRGANYLLPTMMKLAIDQGNLQN